MNARAFICGVSGLELTGTERGFLREAAPWGLILFKRNVDSPDQVRRLIASFRELVGRDEAPVLIDQEGGRVQRLGPPHWPSYPPGREYGRLYDRDRSRGLGAARLAGRLIAAASPTSRLNPATSAATIAANLRPTRAGRSCSMKLP